MSWEKAIDFVLRFEGSTYENNSMDAGGETKFGISKKSYPNEDIKALTRERAIELYRRDYWDPICGDKIPGALAAVVFDCAVNQGLIRAVRLLQAMLGVMADGQVGPKTIAAAIATGNRDVWKYLLLRARLYMQSRDIGYWGHNWGTRLLELAKEFL